MSSHKVEGNPVPAVSSLAKVIRSMRKSRGMTTAAFATLLGVDQSTISRYEAALRMPGEIVLGRLLRLAEGTEKNPILEYASLIAGRAVPEAEVLSTAEREAEEQEKIRRELQTRGTKELPDLARFGHLAFLVCSAEREVDFSLNRILELWLSKASSPKAIDYFRDATLFLEVALGSVSPYQSGDVRAKFRVLRPLDFGDGFVHQVGEILELSLPLARMYPHALLRVEGEDRPAQSKKKHA